LKLYFIARENGRHAEVVRSGQWRVGIDWDVSLKSTPRGSCAAICSAR
jgi:hypothetical protein